MNDCPHGQQARTCEICELEADRLLAKLAHAQVSTVMANSAADAAAEVVGNMAEKLSTLLAERDRLRAALRAVMTETGTSSLAHHYARDALGESAEATDG